MIPIYLYLVGSGLVGFGFWLGRTSGRAAEQRDRERIIDDVVRIRTAYVPIEVPLPVQQGTLAEHHRRLAITASQTPIGAEPATQVRVDVTGRSTRPRTSGNAAPPLDAQSPPRTGGLAGPKPWLVTTLAYRRAQALVALDRVVGPLRTSTGRHRAEDMPRLYGTVAQRRHSAAEHQREVHLSWNTSTQDWPQLVLRQGWNVPEIPATVELGQLVSSP